MCQISSLFLLQRLKGTRQATRAISTSRRELSSRFFPVRQGAEGNSRILTGTLGVHAPSYATVKTWVAQYTCGIFFHL